MVAVMVDRGSRVEHAERKKKRETKSGEQEAEFFNIIIPDQEQFIQKVRLTHCMFLVQHTQMRVRTV
jgi:hypothetical protein